MVNTTENVTPVTTIKYAGFWVRWVAIMVDGLILLIPVSLAQFIVGIALVSFSLSTATIKIISSLIYMLVSWIYFSWMTYSEGATLGKMLVGVTVKSDDFQRLSFGKVLLRETIGKFISGIILCIGYIMAGFTQKKQALHDKFAHSVVIYKDPSKPHRTGLIIGIIIAAFLPIIAILGILSSVVLVSLSTARQKGQDAQVMTDLQQIRANAELYYGANNNSYSYAKSCASGMFLNTNIQQLITNLPNGGVWCYAEGTSYAVSSNLNTSISGYCVDSSGYANTGRASDDGTKASCTPGNSPTEAVAQIITGQNIPQATSTVTKTDYSYIIPSGWQEVSDNTGSDVEAVNRDEQYALSVSAQPLAPALMYVSSIVNATNADAVKAAILSQNSSTVIESIQEGMVGGEKSFVSEFNLTVSSPNNATQTQSIRQDLTQYNVFHKGVAYTLVFIAPYDKRTEAATDFQSIVNSFSFK
jgi:uncharacterized RDD family membrane protein YckC